MIRKLLFLIILLQLSLFSQENVFTRISIDGDNENQTNYKYYLGYLSDIKTNLRLGLLIGGRKYTEPGISDVYNDVRFIAKYSPLDNLSIFGNMSFLSSKDWNPFFYDCVVLYSPIDLLYFEAYIEHESVGTATTNSFQYISTSSGLSTDVNLYEDLTLVVGFTYNTISDGNIKLYQKYRAIYTLPFKWMFVDIKVKLMDGGDFNPNYFSPESLSEYNSGIGIKSELFNSNYYLKAYIGAGVQEVGSESKGLYMGNIKFSADLSSDISAVLSYSITNSQNKTLGYYLYHTFLFTFNYKL